MTPDKTGDELASIALTHPYEPSYLAGWLASFVGLVADQSLGKPAHEAARDQLEKLADYDTFVAAHPLAAKS